MITRKILLAASLSLVSGAAMAQVSIESCETVFDYAEPPARAISVFQQTTEIMLALELEDRLIATAYLEDAIPEKWQAAYESIGQHYEEVPAREVVLASDADFLFSGFTSAFRDNQLGPESEWHAMGVGTYLVDSECRNKYPGDTRIPVETIFVDLERIGALFGVEDRADALIAELKARLDAATEHRPGEGLSAFLFDSGSDTPFSAGCCGSAGLLLESVGLDNIAGDVEGRWADLSWEAVVTADPDVIVLNDAGWSTAEDKRAYMENDPVLSELAAVKAGRFVTVPFSETVLGVRFVDGIERLSDGLAALDIAR
ncbi:ABC transporter substrate-binding protein [Pelagibacterium sediminicola]|uniref:ABC transporter substrate-binding protein n=1 Tax=Pelagibacterium sediminicola TaxID=2248761 RepID=UPI000E30B9F3|nr:ABC transporter substrate-binding protein [Pelagibacterium sediminicola]